VATPGITPAAPPPKPPAPHGATATIGIVPDGLQFLLPSNGEQPFLFNRVTAENAGYVVRINGNSVTASRPGNELVIDAENIREEGPAIVTGTVQSVDFTIQPGPAQVGIGQVAVTAEASLVTFPEQAGIGVTIADTIPDGIRTAFQQEAAQQGQTITAIGYTASFLKSGIAETGPGTIRMTIPHAWVDRNGGIPAVRIMRIGDDKLTEVLATGYAGTDTAGDMIFEAPTPHGLSLFALVTVKIPSAPPAPNSTQAPGPAQNITGAAAPPAPGAGTGTMLVIAGCLGLLAVILVAILKRRKKYDPLFML
jgi:hypothetical protein